VFSEIPLWLEWPHRDEQHNRYERGHRPDEEKGKTKVTARRRKKYK
jgi:hypothetical protein